MNKQAPVFATALLRHPMTLFFVFVSIAVFPWCVSFFFGPIVSPELPLTPSAYAISLTQKAAATSTPPPTSTLSPTPSSTPTPVTTDTPSASPTPVVFGEAGNTLKLYSCPGTNNRLVGQISVGQSFVVLGWNTDNENRVWFLVKDFIDSSQQWVQKQDALHITPDNFDAHINRVSCRE